MDKKFKCDFCGGAPWETKRFYNWIFCPWCFEEGVKLLYFLYSSEYNSFLN